MAADISPHPRELFSGQSYKLDVEGWAIELPIVAIKPDFGISLMMLIDMGAALLPMQGQGWPCISRRSGPISWWGRPRLAFRWPSR